MQSNKSQKGLPLETNNTHNHENRRLGIQIKSRKFALGNLEHIKECYQNRINDPKEKKYTKM